MLTVILDKVYIDKKWVAEEYLRRCKSNAWNKENTRNELKCRNLDCIIDSELMGVPAPKPMTMEELENGENVVSID